MKRTIGTSHTLMGAKQVGATHLHFAVVHAGQGRLLHFHWRRLQEEASTCWSAGLLHARAHTGDFFIRRTIIAGKPLKAPVKASPPYAVHYMSNREHTDSIGQCPVIKLYTIDVKHTHNSSYQDTDTYRSVRQQCCLYSSLMSVELTTKTHN